jgi:transcriptional regulator with XRE-family HTH domain
MKGPTALANTLTRLMEEQGITATALAEKAQVSRSTLGGWKLGVQPQDMNDVRKVAHSLGCSFEYLVFGEEDRDLKRLLDSSPKTSTIEGIFRIKMERIEVEEPRK